MNLSNRQLQVLSLTAQGLRAREIGERLGVSHRTVECMRMDIYKRLPAENCAHAVAIGLRAVLSEALGLDTPSDAGDNLQGAYENLRHDGVSKSCLETIERVIGQLANVRRALEVE